MIFIEHLRGPLRPTLCASDKPVILNSADVLENIVNKEILRNRKILPILPQAYEACTNFKAFAA